MVNYHLKVNISGSKTETIISPASRKDPRAPIRLSRKPSFRSFRAHKKLQGCSCLTEHEIFHWLSLCDRFNIFNATSNPQDESSALKFTNRIRVSQPCKAPKRSWDPSPGLQVSPCHSPACENLPDVRNPFSQDDLTNSLDAHKMLTALTARKFFFFFWLPLPKGLMLPFHHTVMKLHVLWFYGFPCSFFSLHLTQ